MSALRTVIDRLREIFLASIPGATLAKIVGSASWPGGPRQVDEDLKTGKHCDGRHLGPPQHRMQAPFSEGP